MADLETVIREWLELFPGDDIERWVRAVAEESGEFVGAFNKWHDGNRLKSKTRDDVVEELAQLLGCVFVVAAKLDLGCEEVVGLAAEFLSGKAAQIRELRGGV